MDRLPAWAVTSAVFGAAAVGLMLLMPQIPGVAAASTLLIAGALGAELDLIAYMVARYVPARRFGTIFGWIYAGMPLAGPAGPILLAFIRDRTGDYGGAFRACSRSGSIGRPVDHNARRDSGPPLGVMSKVTFHRRKILCRHQPAWYVCMIQMESPPVSRAGSIRSAAIPRC